MKNYFTLSELCILSEPIPQEVADKLLQHHIAPMNIVREKLGTWITASQKSGYRPKKYEINKGRSGKSQHTFDGLGAVDWTTKKSSIQKLLQLLIDETPYSRIAYYPNNNFIHADYGSGDGNRYYYECASPTSGWVQIRKL